MLNIGILKEIIGDHRSTYEAGEQIGNLLDGNFSLRRLNLCTILINNRGK